MDREPLILAFCCHYCAYAAADLAGSMRLQYPQNVRVLRLPCTGKIEVNYLLAAFERGVDGVIVAGCLEGGCHFLEGNLRARRRVARAKELLGGDRLGARAAGDVQPLVRRGRAVRGNRHDHGPTAEAVGAQPVATPIPIRWNMPWKP